MSNVNTLKAIQCLIGSNCIVSTPDAFYVGPKGLISTAEIVQTLDDHNTRISANTSNIVAIAADIQSIYEDINTIITLFNNTKTQLSTLLNKVAANTSNINTLLGDLNTVNDDLNATKATLNSINTSLKSEIAELKPTVITWEMDTTFISGLEDGYYAVKDSSLGEEYSYIAGHIRIYNGNSAIITGLLELTSDGGIDVSGTPINQAFINSGGSWVKI